MCCVVSTTTCVQLTSWAASPTPQGGECHLRSLWHHLSKMSYYNSVYCWTIQSTIQNFVFCLPMQVRGWCLICKCFRGVSPKMWWCWPPLPVQVSSRERFLRFRAKTPWADVPTLQCLMLACYCGQYTLLSLCWYAAVELTIHNCWYLTFAYSQLAQATVVALKAEKSFGILIKWAYFASQPHIRTESHKQSSLFAKSLASLLLSQLAASM